MEKNQLLKIVLTVTASAGVVSTAYLASKATLKAERLVDEDMTRKEAIKATWKLYIPAVSSGVGTVLCIICIGRLGHKQRLALAGAYNMLASSFKDYRDAVMKLYGEEADKAVIEEVASEQAKDTHIVAYDILDTTSLDLEDLGEQTIRFYDVYGERFFEAKPTKVLQAEYHINRNFILEGGISLNDFYEFLGLTPMVGGDDIGWSLYDGLMWIDFKHEKCKDEKGVYYALQFVFYPMALDDYE